jgi:hypothetical protein
MNFLFCFIISSHWTELKIGSLETLLQILPWWWWWTATAIYVCVILSNESRQTQNIDIVSSGAESQCGENFDEKCQEGKKNKETGGLLGEAEIMNHVPHQPKATSVHREAMIGNWRECRIRVADV